MDQNRVENQVDEGTLQIHLTNASTGIPVKGAKISISYTGGPQQVLEEVDTDDSGNTEKITLDAPPLEYSMEPGKTSRMRNIRSRCMPQAIGTLRFRRSISCPGKMQRRKW